MHDLRSTRRHLVVVPGLLLGLLLILAAVPVVMAADPPTNDERAGAAPLAGSETLHVTYDLAGSTTASDDPPLCGSGGSNLGSIWFHYTPTTSGPVIAMVDASNDTAHELHVLAPDGGELGCAVAQLVWPGGTIDFDATAGETYLLAVVGPTIDSETVGQVAIEAVATISLEPPTTGHIDSAGDVEATFVFTCSRPMNMEVGMDLTQGTGASLVRGGDLITVNCFAPSTSVTLTAKGTRDDGVTNAPFKPGPAEWRYDWNAITVVQLFPTQTVFGTLQLDGAVAVAGPKITPPPTDVAPIRSDGPADGQATSAIVAFSIAAIGLMWAVGWRRLRRPRSPRA